MCDKLKPLSGKIKIMYRIKNYDEYKNKKISYFTTYEDFGEWLCRQFSKIKIIDITDKE